MEQLIKGRYFILLMILIPMVVFLFVSSYHESDELDMIPIQPESEKVQLRIITSWEGQDSKAIKLQQVLDQFMKENPGIVVNNDSMSGDEFLFTLKTSFASANDPDLFGLWPGSDSKALIYAGKVADLTELLRVDPAWYGQFGKEAWRYNTVEGRIYGIPFEIIYECLFINKDLFDQHHIPIPHTYEELLYAVSEFRRWGIVPIAYNSTAEGTFIYQNIVMKLAGKQRVEEPFDLSGNIHQEFIDGMYIMKELYEAEAFPDNFFVLSDNERDELFLKKKAAMIVQGSWFIGEPKVHPDHQEVEIIPFPVIREGKSDPTALIYGIGSGNYHISQAAWEDVRKREAAVLLLKDLTSQRTAEIFAEQAGFMGNIKLLNPKSSGRLLKVGESMLEQAKEFIGPVDHYIDRTDWQERLVKQFPLVLEGQLTPEDVFGRFQQK